MPPRPAYRPAPPPPDAASIFTLLAAGPYTRVGAAVRAACAPAGAGDTAATPEFNGGRLDSES